MERQKRAVAVHDISCIGKCSLTVALPVLSAAGVECSVIPTSVLSSHTGGFTGYTFRDLTEDIIPIADHWATLDLPIDAIYTGYLGSAEQTHLMETLFDRFGGSDTLILVDPVMADAGKLYAGFDEHFPALMANVCRRADVVVPNITEAALLLNEPYQSGPYTYQYIEDLVHKLSDAFSAKVVLTGVQFDPDHLGAATYDPAEGSIQYYMRPSIPGYYHGTGDVFGSGLLSALMRGLSLHEAARVAVNFTVASISATGDGQDPKYGVRFEAALPGLMKELELI